MLLFLLRFSLADGIPEKVPHTYIFDKPETLSKNFWTRKGQTISGFEQDDKKTLIIKWDNNQGPDPAGAVEFQSQKFFQYGKYTVRMKCPDTSDQPNAGVISSFFLYVKPREPRDLDNDGIDDVSEIDFEFMAGDPRQIYMTLHTGSGTDSYERKQRVVDLRNGAILQTIYDMRKNGKTTQTPLQHEPQTIPAIRTYSNTKWNTYGFDYYPDKVVFWYDNNGERVLLWDARGKIPNIPMFIYGTLWWSKYWPPMGMPQKKEKPTIPINASYEWIKFEPFENTDNNPETPNSPPAPTQSQDSNKTLEPTQKPENTQDHNNEQTTSFSEGEGVPTDKDKGKTSTGPIVGIVVAVLIVLAVCSAAGYFILRNRNKPSDNTVILV